MCETTQLHSTHMVFNSRSGHLRTQKASKPMAAGGPHWGSLHRSPGPVAGPPPKPHPRSRHFGLPASALGCEATEGLQITVEPGPLRSLLRHWLMCSERASSDTPSVAARRVASRTVHPRAVTTPWIIRRSWCRGDIVPRKLSTNMSAAAAAPAAALPYS